MSDFIGGLDVSKYQYIDDNTDRERIGVMAQQLIDTDPELAQYFTDVDKDGYFSLRVADLIFPAIAAIQELQAQVQ